MNSVAMRLPRVMVPVLSSSRTSTSPAASTARPDIASTLRLSSLSMPAMPMALSKPPIVVGIRQTSKAVRTTTEISIPEYMAYGAIVATEKIKIILMPTSKMVNAISLGVFCLLAPSTSAIIRSRKVSPGFAVIFTLIQSESTRVPPVTEDLSPPASRITGADSPVTALSSTEAIPSMISPSPGMKSPASTSTISPCRKAEASTILPVLPESFFAFVWLRALRKALAWALPRPSAIASAKLANSTVNHSHIEICSVNAAWCVHPPLAAFFIRNQTVSRAPM